MFPAGQVVPCHSKITSTFTGNMKITTKIPTCIATVFFLSCLQGTAVSQDRVWNETDGNWSDSSQWNPTDIPNTSAESAVVGGTNAYSVDFDLSSTVIDNLNISNANASLNIDAGSFSRTLTTTGNLLNVGAINLVGAIDFRLWMLMVFSPTKEL